MTSRQRVPLFALAAIPALVAGTLLWPSAVQDITREQIARVDAIFEPWNGADGPGAAVAVTRNGRTIFSKGYGSAQLEYRIPISPVTVFHVASVSKQFATFAVALLEREGALSWDDELRDHLPETPDFGRRITLRHLATHTSGVRDQWELLAMAGWRLDDVITREQILAMMSRQRELNFEPGTEYLYSNMGYSLLAEVVERASGMGFGEFLEERVFLPLGMHRTHVHADHTMIVPDRAYSYAPLGNGEWRKAVLSYANQGATSLFTTAEDLARWIAEMEEPRVGDRALWDGMRRPGSLDSGDGLPYALGLSVSNHRGLRTVGHGGADAGFRSNLLHFPDEGLGVVVLGNAASFNAGAAARRVAEVFLEDRMDPSPLPEVDGDRADNGDGVGLEELSPSELEAFEGIYYSPELETLYRVELDEGELVLKHHRHPALSLRPLGGDRFLSSAWFMRTLQFARDADDRVEGFRVSGGRVRNLLFVRVEDPALR
jgi:CubicO group peptidase (beta-lactamase class C family)